MQISSLKDAFPDIAMFYANIKRFELVSEAAPEAAKASLL
jgi:hypothetical protein